MTDEATQLLYCLSNTPYSLLHNTAIDRLAQKYFMEIAMELYSYMVQQDVMYIYSLKIFLIFVFAYSLITFFIPSKYFSQIWFTYLEFLYILMLLRACRYQEHPLSGFYLRT